MSPGASRCERSAFMPSVNTGSCSSSQISSALCRRALLGEALHRAPGRLVGTRPSQRIELRRSAVLRATGSRQWRCRKCAHALAQPRRGSRVRRCYPRARARRGSSSAPAGRRHTRESRAPVPTRDSARIPRASRIAPPADDARVGRRYWPEREDVDAGRAQIVHALARSPARSRPGPASGWSWSAPAARCCLACASTRSVCS